MARPEPTALAASPPDRPILRSERLYLQPVEQETLQASVDWFADPEFAEGYNMRAPLTLAAAQAWLEETSKEQGKTRWDFDVRLRSDGRPIGMAGLMDVDPVNGTAELIIGIGERSLRDKGYGTEAVGILLDFVFGELRLHRLQLRVWSFNERAIHVYERVGFQHEVTYREAHFRHGRFHDIHYVSMLVDEWATLERPRTWERD